MTSSVLCAMTTSMGLSTGTLLCSSVRGVTMTTAKPAFRKHSKKGWMLPEFNLCFHARSHAFNTQSGAEGDKMYVPSYSRFERPFKPSKIVQVFHNAGTKRVSQPFECVASTKRVSQPFECVARVKVNVGSFNLGLHQLQIESTRFPTSTLPNFRRIIAKGFEEGDLHLLNLCEVGGQAQTAQLHNLCTNPWT